MPEAEPPVAVIEGTKGKAEIYEIWDNGSLVEYQVVYEGEKESAPSLGMAYILAGDKAGAKT
jgi:hypothetical protein